MLNKFFRKRKKKALIEQITAEGKKTSLKCHD